MIRSAVRAIVETALGLVGVGVLVVRSRFRLRGPYWQWRWHTAFGRGEPSKRELIRGTLEYARWVYQMRRMRG